MIWRRLFCLFCLGALYLPAAAHVLDQYLQVAQIALSSGGVRVELRLIPGVQVADRILNLIDTDGDGQISPAEEQSYARRVMQDLALEIDGQRAPLALESVQFPSRQEMQEGTGAIRLELEAKIGLNTAEEHHFSFHNEHLPENAAYLANIIISKTGSIEIDGLERDSLQHELQASFRVLSVDAAAPNRRMSWWGGLLLFAFCSALLIRQWKHLIKKTIKN